MKEVLHASAAFVLLALVSPIAAAQPSGPSATPPSDEAETPTNQTPDTVNDPMEPQAQQTPPPTVSPPHSTGIPNDGSPASPGVNPAMSEQEPAAQSSTLQSAQPSNQTPTYPAQEGVDMRHQTMEQMRPVDLAETARLAGMDDAPMTASEVCEPRILELARGTSRLTRDSRRDLSIAVDHASVCEIQRVVVESPDGRGEAVRQTLVAQGVEDGVIQVQRAEDRTLRVEMTFAGVATSSPEYAALFHPARAATYPAGAQPSTSTAPDAATSNLPGGVEPPGGTMNQPQPPIGPDDPTSEDPAEEDTPSSTY